MKRVPLSFFEASYEPSFTSVIGSSLLFVFISTAIIIGSLFLTIKFLGSEHSFKSITGIYGTHLIPSTFLVLISFILLLLKAYTYSNFLLSFALLFSFFIIPLYILIKLLTKEEGGIDPLYCVLAYIVIFGIAFSIYLRSFGRIFNWWCVESVDDSQTVNEERIHTASLDYFRLAFGYVFMTDLHRREASVARSYSDLSHTLFSNTVVRKSCLSRSDNVPVILCGYFGEKNR